MQDLVTRRTDCGSVGVGAEEPQLCGLSIPALHQVKETQALI